MSKRMHLSYDQKTVSVGDTIVVILYDLTIFWTQAHEKIFDWY